MTMLINQFLRPLSANKRETRQKCQDFTVKNLTYTSYRQATLNSTSFLVTHSSTKQYNNSFFICTTTGWNLLNNDQMKAPSLEDIKQQLFKAKLKTFLFSQYFYPN